MGVRDWLQGIKESLVWIAEEVWRWIRHPPAAVLLLAVCVASCKPDPPTPTPTPSPTPKPTPTPECCIVPDSEAAGWQEATVEVPYNELFIRAARESVGDPCGQPPANTLALVADALEAQNVCAEGPWADAVLVARPDGNWEEWHVVEYTKGCWYPLSKAFKGAWFHPAAVSCR